MEEAPSRSLGSTHAPAWISRLALLLYCYYMLCGLCSGCNESTACMCHSVSFSNLLDPDICTINRLQIKSVTYLQLCTQLQNNFNFWSWFQVKTPKCQINVKWMPSIWRNGDSECLWFFLLGQIPNLLISSTKTCDSKTVWGYTNIYFS